MSGILGFGARSGSAAAGWGFAEPIDDGSGFVGVPQVDENDDGVAFAVWGQDQGATRNIWYARRLPGVGWLPPGVVDIRSERADYPFVGVDSAGIGIAVWLQVVGGTDSVFASRYVPGAGWESQRQIDGTTNDMFGLDFAMSEAGYAAAAWHQFDTGQISVYANQYDPSSGWGTATLLETSPTQATYPSVGVDNAGNAMVVWTQGTSLWASRYTVSLGWGSAQQVDTGGTGWQRVAVDDSGNAIAVWNGWDGSVWSLNASRYVLGVGWSAPVSLESGNGETINPQIAMTPSGDGVVVWRQVGTSARDIHAAVYTVAGGWGADTLLETWNDESGDPQVDVSPDGHAMAVWPQWEATNTHVWASAYVPGAGWAPPELIETENAGQAGYAQVAVDGTGNAVVAWLYSDTLARVWANIYESADTTPPALTLTSPADGSVVSTPTVTVAGTTEPGASLVVNGLLPAVASDGTFSFPLALLEGTNTITATATDGAGNRAVATRTVTYVSPIAGLQQDLQDARDELNATRDDLSALRDELTGSQGGLTRANADLAGLRALVLALFGLAVLQLLLTVFVLRRRGGRPSPSAPPPPPA